MTDQDLDRLFQFICGKVALTPSDRSMLSCQLKGEEYKKGDLVLKENQTCKFLKFVVSGIYRVYQTENGKEITSYFCYETRNPFVASFPSLLTNAPSKETIECIAPGKLLSIRYADWRSLYESSHALNTFGRQMAEFNYLLAVERIASLQYQSAKDRYQSFITLYPQLLNLIPHHYIASYLGITPESLSRIRKSA